MFWYSGVDDGTVGKAPQALWLWRNHPIATSTVVFRDQYRRERKHPLEVDTLHKTSSIHFKINLSIPRIFITRVILIFYSFKDRVLGLFDYWIRSLSVQSY